jgi:hypothetical protein
MVSVVGVRVGGVTIGDLGGGKKIGGCRSGGQQGLVAANVGEAHRGMEGRWGAAPGLDPFLWYGEDERIGASKRMNCWCGRGSAWDTCRSGGVAAFGERILFLLKYSGVPYITGDAICRLVWHGRGAAHPFDPAAVNWAAVNWAMAHQVNVFFCLQFYFLKLTNVFSVFKICSKFSVYRF